MTTTLSFIHRFEPAAAPGKPPILLLHGWPETWWEWHHVMPLLAERWRLKGHEHDFGHGSPLRHHSYLARGRYITQLDVLTAAFPPSQVLLLRSRDLREFPQQTVEQVVDFLQLPPLTTSQTHGTVFAGDWQGRWLPNALRPWLGLLYRGELEVLRARYGITLAP